MDSVVLPNGRATSRIGFGCAQLRGGSYAETSRTLVVAALDAGIRHLVLAPSYALGLAEDVAGSILAPLKDEVIIITKVGITRPRAPGLLTAIRRAAKPLLAWSPELWTLMAGNVRKAAGNRQCFDPEFVRASAQDNLRRLRVDAVDILLMDEMNVGEVTDRLMAVLDELMSIGKVGALGTGGDRAAGRLIAAENARLGQVRQFVWNILEPPIESATNAFCITHGAIGSGLERAIRLLRKNPEKSKGWSAILDADLADPGVLSGLLLGAALAENADGVVLMASQNPMHIRKAAAVAGDPDLIARASRLGALVREDAGAVRRAGAPTGGMLLDGSAG